MLWNNLIVKGDKKLLESRSKETLLEMQAEMKI